MFYQATKSTGGAIAMADSDFVCMMSGSFDTEVR